MKLRILLVSLLATVCAAAQVPDEEDILRKTLDSESEFYYPGLMLRYQSGDTTLTATDYHYLYYGFAYQDAYSPLKRIPAENQILEIFERGESLSFEEAAEVVALGKQVMETDPFSPKNLNFMAYAYGVTGDTISAAVYADRLKKVLGTILASGTGLKEDRPWHVLHYDHATDVIGSKGLVIVNRQVRSSSVEYIQLARRDKDGAKGYFFDFGRMYRHRPEEAPQKEKHKWDFNNIPLNYKRSR